MRIVLVFLVSYGVVALRDRSHEAFPFFAWNLFSSVPASRSGDYDVRILSAQGLSGRTPVYFEDAHLEPGTQVVQGYVALQSWGKFWRENQWQRAAVVRHRFASIYLRHVSHVRYQLVRRQWDIRTRVTCRSCFSHVRVLGTYTTQ
jgi:hypothetical protein